jgi:hypothetical protein
MGPPPGLLNGMRAQTEIVEVSGQKGVAKKEIQIPADQDVRFTYFEYFGKLALRCDLEFSVRAKPNQIYILIMGDVPPTPRGSTAMGEIVHVLEAGDVPRCWVHRYQQKPDGTLEASSFNDVTFEAQVY